MRVLFMGTPDFAVPCLKTLIENNYDVCGVVTQPDKPKGRGHKMTPPPVKVCAGENDIPVYQPVSCRDEAVLDEIRSLKPDVIVVAAYGKILPHDFLVFPKYGCINVHASILPAYRGASPIHAAVLNGDKTTGVTVQQMDDGVDTGDILNIGTAEIGINDTTEYMYEVLAPLGAKVLMQTIDMIEKGTLNPVKQDESKVSKAGLLSKEMSAIDWNKTAFEIHNQIRGLYSWPGASTKFSGKTLKIHTSILSDKKGHNIPGEVVFAKDVLTVCCGDNNCVDLICVQPEGKKRMDASSFVNGYRIEKGVILG